MNTKFLKNLKIAIELPNIIKLVKDNQVLIVQAETGTGKTVGIPPACLEAFPYKKITVTQPRRPSVILNSEYISGQMFGRVGELIGWKLRDEKPRISKKTRCFFLVDQSLLNKISREKKLPKGIIIVDEAHERSTQIEQLLIMIKELLPESPETKLIVTSATIDTKKFSKFFNDAPILSVKADRCFPVETSVEVLERGEHHSSRAILVAAKKVESFINNKLTIPDVEGVVNEGTLLVFLPGKEDVLNGIAYIKKMLSPDCFDNEEIEPLVEILTLGNRDPKTSKKKIELFPCHSELSSDEQRWVTRGSIDDNTLRVIFTTDIARSSLTLPKVVGVIDSLQIKRKFVNKQGVSHLDKISVSKAEADQAKGRPGRTQPGFYIAIGSEYSGGLKEYPTPAILREALTSIMLQFVFSGLNPRTCSYIDSPGEDKISVALKRLQKIGALDENEKITELGKILINFPLDPERAKALITADKLGVLSEAVIVTACIEAEGIFHNPRNRAKLLASKVLTKKVIDYLNEEKDNDDEKFSFDNLPDYNSNFCITKDNKKKDFFLIESENNYGSFDELVKLIRGDSVSDFSAMVKVFRKFKNYEFELKNSNLSYREREKELTQFCFDNFLNYKKMRKTENIVRQIKEEIYSSPLNFQNHIWEVREFDSDSLTKSIASGLIDNIGNLLDNKWQYSSPKGEFSVAHNSCCKNAELVLIAELKKIASKGRRTSFTYLADLAAPIKLEWLEEIMPQFCKYERGINIHYSFQNDQVQSTTKVYCNDQFVGEKFEIDNKNEDASQVFANWLAENTLELV